MALWSFPGCPNTLLLPQVESLSEPPRQSKMAQWLSGASRAAQIAKHLTKGHGRSGKHLTKGHRGLAKCVHFTINFAKRGPNPRPHEIFNPASTSLKVTGDKKGCARFCAKCVHFTINFAKRGPNPRPGDKKGGARFCVECVHFTINFAKRGPKPAAT